MRHVRLGSYSIADTFAGTPTFSRRKSMRRYWRLCPPPRHRVVMCPLLLRPPDFVSGSTSERSGSVFVTSAKSETDRKRVALVTGLTVGYPCQPSKTWIASPSFSDTIAFFHGPRVPA